MNSNGSIHTMLSTGSPLCSWFSQKVALSHFWTICILVFPTYNRKWQCVLQRRTILQAHWHNRQQNLVGLREFLCLEPNYFLLPACSVVNCFLKGSLTFVKLLYIMSSLTSYSFKVVSPTPMTVKQQRHM